MTKQTTYTLSTTAIFVTLLLSFVLMTIAVLLLLPFFNFYMIDINNKIRIENTTYIFKSASNTEVFFKQEVYQTLVDAYTEEKEDFYCLLGHQDGNNIIITSLYQPALIYLTPHKITWEETPPCQIETSVGSFHTHPFNVCHPSWDDLFTFGNMKNPEPLIQIIECDVGKFNILEMPGENEGLNLGTLKWRVID